MVSLCGSVIVQGVLDLSVGVSRQNSGTLSARAKMTPPVRTVSPEILAAADQAVRSGDATNLPAEIQPQLKLIQDAFSAFSTGNDEKAREYLQAIGLSSPFLEWKLLLRGLMSHAAGDAPRANENWSRLDPQRLPAKLAAPFRVTIDEAYRSTFPARTLARLNNARGRLGPTDLIDRLEKIRAEGGKGKSLSTAFRTAEAIVPRLAKRDPDAVNALALWFYREIIIHGQPEDLGRYRKIFGDPIDDPDFDRLRAQIHENLRSPIETFFHWISYAEWLDTATVWTEPVRLRAMAEVLFRIGQAVRRIHAVAEPLKLMRNLRSPSGDKISTEPTEPWLKAMELAPEWDAPTNAIIDWHLSKEKVAEALAVISQALPHQPHNLALWQKRGDLALVTGDFDLALTCRDQARKLNPLDPTLRDQLAELVMRDVRRRAIAGDLTAADERLAAHLNLVSETRPLEYHAYAAVRAWQTKKPDLAEEHLEAAIAPEHAGPAGWWAMLALAHLLGLPPRLRKPLAEGLQSSLEVAPTVAEAILLHQISRQIFVDEINFRGRTTYDRWISEHTLLAGETNAPIEEFDRLLEVLCARGDWMLTRKLAQLLIRRRRTSGIVYFALARAEYSRQKSPVMTTRIRSLFIQAASIARLSGDPRYQDLPERIRNFQERASRHIPFYESLR